MTNAEIRNACERAKNLASELENEIQKDIAFGQILSHLLGGAATSEPASSDYGSTSAVKSAGIQKRPVEGLKARLVELHSNGFFADLRTAGDVATELKALGWVHQSKEISARLQDLTRSRLVRRSAGSGRKGSYAYSNW